jgi:hypothetical protein
MPVKFQKFSINKVQAQNFILSPLELRDYLDFPVKRIYFISAISGNTNSHCHKIEKELFLLAQGRCTAVIDQGYGLEEIKLQALESAIYIGNYVWHHFKDFSPDAILLALSSTNYSPDRSDYIEDYEEFKKRV